MDSTRFFRDRAAIDRHERLSGPAGGALDAARDDFLADAAFAQDQNRNVGTRGPFGQAHHLAHRRGAGDHVVKAHAAFGLAGQALHLARQGLQLQGILDRHDHAFRIGGLHDEIHRAAAHGLDNRVDAAGCGQHDHRQVCAFRGQPFQRVHAGQAGHGQVKQYDINAVFRVGCQRQASLAIRRRPAGKAGLLDRRLQQAALRRIIINHQNRLGHVYHYPSMPRAALTGRPLECRT